eukprot:CAMPEP_0116568926 /NCGR_PEP_ID=MMETSP0397-20121206/15973_1 /TAXON_ID=216820 /ORGANISM="Cyclophora tenuis, Strain ECT3854" /LENGTH=532 /DNA_ID=CAMNT_0004096361 /DNA_START=33 /DNA_END=1631 /DNA_ORIENTATION=-
MKVPSSLLLFLLPSVVSSSPHLRVSVKEGGDSCSVAADESSCNAAVDDDGKSCVWCRCAAIPSECLTQDQAAQVPPGVFDCSTPSTSSSSDSKSLLSQMVLTQKPLDDDFCDVNGKSGYVAIPDSKYDKDGENKHLFYWMFEKRSSDVDVSDASIPFVVWLTGGPGCSSSLALLTENGPCKVNKDGKTTSLNPYSWTEAGHVLWLDQPAGVGFSYGKATDKNEEMVSEDAYWFLQKFFEANPQYSSNPLYIIGESYGGHYAPAIAHRINVYNKKLPSDDAKVLNLSGLAVGNGLTAPEEQYKWYPEMAFNNSHGIKAVNKETYETMKAVVPQCVKLIHQCNKGDNMIDDFACQSAFEICNLGLTSPYQATGLNPYDIRKPCGSFPLCYDFSAETRFMDSQATREALGVVRQSHKWESCNMGINLKFHTDWMKDFSHFVADLLNDDIPVLIYAGDVDFICNYLGNKAWTHELQWKGGDDFRAATEHEWKGAGSATTTGIFTFLQVYDAGHMVPTDQPKVALDMLETFVSGGSF